MDILNLVTDSKRNLISIADFEPQSGALTEVCGLSGCGKTEAVLRWLGRHLGQQAGERVAWVEREFTAYPVAFPQYGVALSRVCFVDAEGADERTLGWVTHQVISSQAFGVVVIARAAAGAPAYTMVELRRLQLAAEKSQARVVLLSEQASSAELWPIRFQVEVSRSPVSGELRLHVLRNRGGAVALSADSLLSRVEELRARREAVSGVLAETLREEGNQWNSA